MTAEALLEVIRACARGDEVSPTQLRAAIYLLEREEAGDEQPLSVEEELYGGSNVVPINKAG